MAALAVAALGRQLRDDDIEPAVNGMMWQPAYEPYLPACDPDAERSRLVSEALGAGLRGR